MRNILHDGAGQALLGDFGAASFFALEDQERAAALQRIEVRAFACLLEELLMRSPGADSEPDVHVALADLQARCAHASPLERPPFTEIRRLLDSLLRQSLRPASATI